MNYMTDKLIFIKNKILYDALGNAVKMEYETVSKYNLSIILASNINGYYKKEFRLKQKDCSVTLDSEKFNTFGQISDGILKLMRYIEYSGCQYAIKRSLKNNDMKDWDYLNFLYNDQIRDGNITSKEFAQQIEMFNKENSILCSCYTIYSNILYLNEMILDELFHSEARIIECVNHQIDNLRGIEKKELKGQTAFEYTYFSMDSDNAAWCIQDAIKSLASCLDGISKLVDYLSESKEIPKKIPNRYFSDIGDFIEKWRSCPEKEEALRMMHHLKILTLLRNEVTHNRSLNSTRFPLFIGKGTNIINGLPLMYSDMFFWDNDKNNFEKACNRMGFYSKKLNALTEIHDMFVMVVKFSDLVLRYLVKNLQLRLLEHNIPVIRIFDEVAANIIEVKVGDIGK